MLESLFEGIKSYPIVVDDSDNDEESTKEPKENDTAPIKLKLDNIHVEGNWLYFEANSTQKLCQKMTLNCSRKNRKKFMKRK